MPNPKKVEKVKEFTDKFSRAKGIYFTNYSGLDVQQMNDLRSELRVANVEFKIVKNTLSRIAVENAGYCNVTEFLHGPIGIVFSYDDPSIPAKIITSFTKKNQLETLEIKGCIFDNTIYYADQISEIVALPSREEIIAKLIAVLVAPISNLVSTLNTPITQLFGVLRSSGKEKTQ